MKRKKRTWITAVAVLVFFGCFLGITQSKEVVTTLSRNPYGKGDATYLVQVERQGEVTQMELLVPEGEPDSEEWELQKEEVISYIERSFAESLSKLTKEQTVLSLPEYYEDCQLTWESLSKPAVDDSGYVWFALLEEETVKFQVTIRRKEQEAVCLVKGNIPNQEADWKQEVREMVQEQTGTKIELPGEVQGQKIIFYQKKNGFLWLPALVSVLVILWQCCGKELWEKKKEARKIRLRNKEFPEFLSQLILYLRAGMSIRKAWDRLIIQWEKKKDSVLLSEMLGTRNQIRSGIGESRAYEEFGVRCGSYFYKRVGSFLAQAVERSGEALLPMLEEELEHYYQEEKHQARKKGEEAGTKLLIPTGIQFILLMMTMMLPALLAFKK